jgi:hypothetical protein
MNMARYHWLGWYEQTKLNEWINWNMYAPVKIGDNEVRQGGAEKMIDSGNAKETVAESWLADDEMVYKSKCDREMTDLSSFSSPWKRAAGGNNPT